MRLAYGGASDVGLHRRENQDRLLADGRLFAVADGLGGHRGGSVAAEIAVSVLARREGPDSLDQLIALIGAANAAVHEEARGNPGLWNMATTLCALADIGDEEDPCRLAVGNVGDSRLYVLVDGSLTQLTVDHTIAEMLAQDGMITRDQAADHADRHMLTRAVGYESRMLVDGWELRAVSGARFLICSDGLTNELSDSEIAEALGEIEDPSAAAGSLVESAVRPGHGHDNATVVVVDVIDGLEPSEQGPELVIAARSRVAVSTA